MKNRQIKLMLLVAMVPAAVWGQREVSRRDTTLSVGYTQGDVRTMSGKAERVGEERMNKGLVRSSLDALSGQAAGVQIQSRTNTSAMLSSVRVRGTTSLTGGNDPLVIIDGVQSDLTTLSNIYPADIESFTILKDASETAQYGSRGASGVIEVTTKRRTTASSSQADGASDAPFSISYDTNLGFSSAYKNLAMLSAADYQQAIAGGLGSAWRAQGKSAFPDAITRTAFVENHHVAFGGDTQSGGYRASLGYMKDESVVRTIGSRNFSAKLDLSQRAFDDHLTIDLGILGLFQKNKLIFDDQKLFYSSAAFNPTYPTGKNPDGTWSQSSEASQINHPRSLLDILDHEDNAHFNTHVKAAWDFGAGLTLTAFGSYSYNTEQLSQFMPTYVWSHGQAYRGSAKTEELLGNLSLNYTKTWQAHHLDLLALAEASKSTLREFHTQVQSLSTNAYGYDNLSAGAVRLWEATGSSYEDPRMASFLAHANYVLAGRYTFTINARADGSSKVGRNHRWGFFPSGSLAWIVSDEAWMKQFTWLSNLKLRAGYGLSGNLGAIDCYNALPLMMPSGVVSVEGTPAVTLSFIRNANPDLKWEVKRTLNAGADIGLLGGRLVVTADFYRSKTTDMLYMYDVPVPPFTYNKLLANLGSMRSSGFELGVGASIVQKRDVDLNVNLNVAYQTNRLLSLSGWYGDEYLTGPESAGIASMSGAGFHGGENDVVYQMIGQPLGVFYLPHCTGLTQNADGTYSYETDGVRRLCGQATPKVLLGSNISFRYKDFDVSLQVNGAFGHKIFNGTALTYMNMASLPYYNVYREAPARNISDQTVTDYWLERGDYLNFDYLTIGWNVPVEKFSRYISRLRLSLSINNLATITGYSGLTPMINSSVVGSTLGLDDKRTYPVYRTYSFGLSIQF